MRPDPAFLCKDRACLRAALCQQKQPDLLPSALNLPRITAEEYMANFVEILRNMLSKCPPLVPSVAAVDLLVATAGLQRYLHVRGYSAHQEKQDPETSCASSMNAGEGRHIHVSFP